ncbi:hypothetical protein [Cellulomonas sp. S1-8]|uniref:hypothetical protein n=1 Tax=Cellulomonas sp. S1-8 TaxID=2904790 RepID=UPI00224491DE|nr:hypothetical protein [Cellulomonas sp. S1-8]UZN04186.1 hypothetical protein OKX07_04405 [Cellulomonas sp. S1-8]
MSARTYGYGRVGRAVPVVAALLLGLAAGPADAAPAVDGPAGSEALGTSELAGARGQDLVRGRYVPRAVDLGVPGERSQALMVSESGVVVGTFQDPDGPSRTFRWRDGTLEILTGVENSYPTDVNRAGQVVLYGDGPWFRSQAFLWDVDGTLTQIFENDAEVAAYDINDRGVATFQFTFMFGSTAGRWDRAQGPHLFEPENAVESGVARGKSLNERGEVLGWLLEPDYVTGVGWVWRDGAFTYLRGPAGASVTPRAINERGQVLGYAGATATAVLWERDGRVRPLDPKGLFFSGPVLNDRGVAAGKAVPPGSTTSRAAIADVRGVTFLGGSGAFPSAAVALTNHGLVAGWAARDAAGAPRATVWVLGKPVALGEQVGGVAGVESTAQDVNERGLVAGTVTTATSNGQPLASRAVVWELVPRR